MRILHTDEIDTNNLSRSEKLAFYNAMDVLITREVYDVTHKLLDETTIVTYNFMKALQAPILEMQLRGYLIDKKEKRKKIKMLGERLVQLESVLNPYAIATWGKPINARSWQQKGQYLYDFAKCKEIKKFDYKVWKSKRTTDREAIEKLSADYLKVRPVCLCIMGIMDLTKRLGTLKSGVDSDGYLRASYMIAGTSTGRLSSKTNIFGRGTNLQNIGENLRSMFTVEDGPIPERDKYYIPEKFR